MTKPVGFAGGPVVDLLLSLAAQDDERERNRNILQIGHPMTTKNFIAQHCRRALEAEPTWTISMYCAFNDFDDDIEQALRRLFPALAKRDRP